VKLAPLHKLAGIETLKPANPWLHEKKEGGAEKKRVIEKGPEGENTPVSDGCGTEGEE